MTIRKSLFRDDYFAKDQSLNDEINRAHAKLLSLLLLPRTLPDFLTVSGQRALQPDGENVRSDHHLRPELLRLVPEIMRDTV